jgi:uncharacterized membrane protein
MGLATLVLVGMTGFAAILVVGRTNGVFAGHIPAPSHPTSPLDEAERILSARYAKGEITPEEYARMLTILRR